MTDSFEKFINGFTDEEFDDWSEGENTTYKGRPIKGATDAQAKKAINVRTPLSKEEEEDIEAEQEFIPEPSRVEQVDTSHVIVETPSSPRRINRVLDALGSIGQKPDTIRIDTQLEPVGIDLPTKNIIPRVSPQLPERIIITPSIPTPTQTRNILDSFRSLGRRIAGLFRRKR